MYGLLKGNYKIAFTQNLFEEMTSNLVRIYPDKDIFITVKFEVLSSKVRLGDQLKRTKIMATDNDRQFMMTSLFQIQAECAKDYNR